MCLCLKYLLISQFKLLKWSYTLSSMYSQSNNLESVDGDSFLLGTVPTISRLWGLPSHKMHFSGAAIMIHWISGIMFPVINTFGLKILIIIKVCMVLWFWPHNITKNLWSWSSFSCADVFQQHADRLIQTAEASSGVLLHHLCHHMWPNPHYSAQEPPHWRLPGLPARRGHRSLPSEMNISILSYIQ